MQNLNAEEAPINRNPSIQTQMIQSNQNIGNSKELLNNQNSIGTIGTGSIHNRLPDLGYQH